MSVTAWVVCCRARPSRLVLTRQIQSSNSTALIFFKLLPYISEEPSSTERKRSAKTLHRRAYDDQTPYWISNGPTKVGTSET